MTTAPMAGGPTAEFLTHVGAQIRSRRKAMGMTVQQLADDAEVSRRMLTQIELGKANPSLVFVDKVARALGTDFASLIRVETTDVLSVIPAAETTVVWSSGLGSHAALNVATTSHPAAELWTWTLQPQDIYHAQPDSQGSQELFLVLTGKLTLEVEGVADVTLGPGASARLASDRVYSYANHTSRPVRFIRVAQVT
ncbi:MAG: XRE family transcriptional regulator [Candidatus Nanopelagicales bacterium]